MPPRKAKKRAAPQRLEAIAEQEDAPADNVASTSQEQGTEQIVHALIKECRQKVQVKTEDMLYLAHTKALHLRQRAEEDLLRLSKQVRSMTVAEFFGLNAEEASSSTLPNVMAKLLALQSATGATGAEFRGSSKDAAAVAAALAAPAGAAATGQAESRAQQQQQEARGPQESTAVPPTSGGLMPPPPPRPARKPEAACEVAADTMAASGAVGTSSVNGQPSTSGQQLVAKAAPRPPTADEMLVYSANGSPIYLPRPIVEAAAATAGPSASTAAAGASQQQAALGNRGAMGLETPMPGAGAGKGTAAMTAAAAAPGLLMTGHTFRRATAARGRTKAASRAITVTIHDGSQFVVDDMVGLSNVPARYHAEVAAILTSDQADLTALTQTVLKAYNGGGPAGGGVGSSRAAAGGATVTGASAAAAPAPTTTMTKGTRRGAK